MKVAHTHKNQNPLTKLPLSTYSLSPFGIKDQKNYESEEGEADELATGVR
jgi:hypothetical protein